MGQVNSKPTALGVEAVRAIKIAMMEGYSNAQLAHAYNCAPETMSRIRRGASYNHVRVPGDERLRKHLNREGEAGVLRVVVPVGKVDMVEEMLKTAPELDEEAEKRMAALLANATKVQAEQEAEEVAQAAKEAEEERLAEELEGKGTSQDAYFAQTHLTGEAKEKIALDLGGGASLKEQPLPTFELTGKVSAEAVAARERAERGE